MPVLGSAGRYLYYLRPDPSTKDAPSEYRARFLWRYDFLNEEEQPATLLSQ